MIDSQSTSARESQNDKQDFLLFCSSNASQQDLAQAVHALYYLPDNYKLVVLEDETEKVEKGHKMPWADSSIQNRIQFSDTNSNQTETSKQKSNAPFFDADVVISDEQSKHDFQKSSAPEVRIDSHISEVHIENNGFRVPFGSPEALATALLRLAHAR